MKVSDFFTHEKIGEGLWGVTEKYQEQARPFARIYVIEGGEKYAVIDSGFGAVDGLRKYIEENITGDKPLMCLVSSVRTDCVGGAALFDEIAMCDLEFPDLEWRTDIELRFKELGFFREGKEEIKEFCSQHYVKKRLKVEDCTVIRDGDIIDIGGVKLHTVLFPSYSKGGVCFVEPDKKWIFSGAMITGGGGIASREAAENIVKGLKKIIEIADPESEVWSGHEMQVMPMQLIYDKLQCTEEILAGVNLENDVPSQLRNFGASKDETDEERKAEKRMTHYCGISKSTYNAYDFQ